MTNIQMLYVNGDSHTAAAEATNPHAFAEDDGMYWGLGRQPHPDNLRVSYGCELANHLNLILECGAESASSNQRIIRTTQEWLETQNDDPLVIIQWSTWEREEWLHDNIYYQVNASGIDHVPTELQQQYKEFVANINWHKKTKQAHDEIWAFHNKLKDSKIRHIFFNGNNNFSQIHNQMDWGKNYISPYDPNMTFDQILRKAGFNTVSTNSWHFGEKAHSFFARFMLQYIIDNNFI